SQFLVFIPATFKKKNSFVLFLLKISGFYAQQGAIITLTPKDSITLILVTVLEFFFYRFYFSKAKVTKAA
ncbi:MAG: hypothetical protein ABI462_10630, partial [Ignavibacteria bacterium]